MVAASRPLVASTILATYRFYCAARNGAVRFMQVSFFLCLLMYNLDFRDIYLILFARNNSVSRFKFEYGLLVLILTLATTVPMINFTFQTKYDFEHYAPL